jgi:hypothetical protein
MPMQVDNQVMMYKVSKFSNKRSGKKISSKSRMIQKKSIKLLDQQIKQVGGYVA